MQERILIGAPSNRNGNGFCHHKWARFYTSNLMYNLVMRTTVTEDTISKINGSGFRRVRAVYW